ncbi:MAG: SurA N-terminal domain-containing protein [Spirochaetia bacterium]|nr:SurA N-terminal domain-containing protein [Spirochaetia bacterium]
MIKRTLVFIILAGFLLNCKGGSSPWVWKIDGKKYTVSDFDDAYENYINLMAQQLQLSPEQLKSMIKNPEKSGIPEENMEMLRKLSKDNFPDQYKQLVLLNVEAKKKGFTKKKEIQSRINFIQQFYTASLFMAEKAEVKADDVSDDEALKAWEMIRNSNPQMRTIPLDKGLAATKQRLAMKKAFDRQQESIKDIMEAYPIETNPDFKLKDYIKKSEEQTSKPEDKAK